nr:adenosylcobinamide amidohydrolase [Streptomyces lycii]
METIARWPRRDGALVVERAARREDGACRHLLVWRAGPGWRMLSSGVLGGGLGERQWVVNAEVRAGYGRTDPDRHLAGLASAAGLSGPGVGLMTAAPVDEVTRAEDGGVTAVVTTGLGVPTWAAADEPPADGPRAGEPRAGERAADGPQTGQPPADGRAADGPRADERPVDGPPAGGPRGDQRAGGLRDGRRAATPPDTPPATPPDTPPGVRPASGRSSAAAAAHVPGTVNILVVVPAEVSDAGLVNLATTATEAKVQALLDTGHDCSGTASDAVCVAVRSPVPGRAPEPFGGPRSLWGSRLARAVYRAVREGAELDRARREHGPAAGHPAPVPGCRHPDVLAREGTVA